MMSFISGIDALGLGALIGSLLFLGGLLWVIFDNRSFEHLEPTTRPGNPADPEPPAGRPVRPGPGRGRTPDHPRRAA